MSGARQVVPLFVVDPALGTRSANRARFLAESLADLRTSLRERGADLVLRRGDPAAEVIRLATAIANQIGRVLAGPDISYKLMQDQSGRRRASNTWS
jgi:deoxyribodipyrimidine photo-lyase